MSKKAIFRYHVIQNYREGKTLRKEAALLLGVSERHITRLCAKVRTKGAYGLVHGNTGRAPKNKYDEKLKQTILDLKKSIYPDFNVSHSLEKIVKDHNLKVSYSTFRSWCKLNGLSVGRRKRRSKRRVVRERMRSEGLLLQMDGSHHAWNGRDKWCLIAAIDDATSDIPYAEFFKTETTEGCMKVLRKIIELKGIPGIIYTDQAGWSTGGKRDNFSQFVRACEELGIRVIATSSPEAKGRIERAWRTIQGRLIPELRLNNIKSMTASNEYLQQVFLKNYWKQQNTVLAVNEVNQYRAVPSDLNLDTVFCLKYIRKISRSQTIHFNHRTYRIENTELGDLKGKEVVVLNRHFLSFLQINHSKH